MTQTVLERPHSTAAFHAASAASAIACRLKKLYAVVNTWRRRHKSSMQCARVESRILRDLGISEAQRFVAVNKPFWEE